MPLPTRNSTSWLTNNKTIIERMKGEKSVHIVKIVPLRPKDNRNENIKHQFIVVFITRQTDSYDMSLYQLLNVQLRLLRPSSKSMLLFAGSDDIRSDRDRSEGQFRSDRHKSDFTSKASVKVSDRNQEWVRSDRFHQMHRSELTEKYRKILGGDPIRSGVWPEYPGFDRLKSQCNENMND